MLKGIVRDLVQISFPALVFVHQIEYRVREFRAPGRYRTATSVEQARVVLYQPVRLNYVYFSANVRFFTGLRQVLRPAL